MFTFIPWLEGTKCVYLYVGSCPVCSSGCKSGNSYSYKWYLYGGISTYRLNTTIVGHEGRLGVGGGGYVYPLGTPGPAGLEVAVRPGGWYGWGERIGLTHTLW